MQINSHGTITEHNLQQRYQDTAKYGPLRVKLSRPVVQAMNKLGWIWSLDGGDLLAAFRDGGKMLPHDDDFDLWFCTDEVNIQSSHEAKKELLEKKVEEIGKVLPEGLKARATTSYCYKLEVYDEKYDKYPFRDTDYYNVSCDISLVIPMKKIQPQGEQWYRLDHEQCAKFNLSFLKTTILPVKPDGIMFQGYLYNCPADTEGYLKAHYGYLGKDSCYDKVSGLYQKRIEK